MHSIEGLVARVILWSAWHPKALVSSRPQTGLQEKSMRCLEEFFPFHWPPRAHTENIVTQFVAFVASHSLRWICFGNGFDLFFYQNYSLSLGRCGLNLQSCERSEPSCHLASPRKEKNWQKLIPARTQHMEMKFGQHKIPDLLYVLVNPFYLVACHHKVLVVVLTLFDTFTNSSDIIPFMLWFTWQRDSELATTV